MIALINKNKLKGTIFMKQVINGKLYNTETAQFLTDYYSRFAVNDFNWYREELYIKKTGEYFLYGEGNAMSPYTESCGQSSWTGGSAIIPLTEIEAKKWVERKCNDDYEEIFGKIEE